MLNNEDLADKVNDCSDTGEHVMQLPIIGKYVCGLIEPGEKQYFCLYLNRGKMYKILCLEYYSCEKLECGGKND